MEISKELNYVTEEQMKDIENQITIIAKQLSKLRTTLSNSSLHSKPYTLNKYEQHSD